MTYVKNNFAVRFVQAMRRGLARHRRGSVLILVVALLVILALIGTAWMAAARNDRYGATQNTTNTQIDLLVEGAIALVQGVIVDDLFGAAGYRPYGAADYEHADSPRVDPWIAERLPVAVGGTPTWWSISAPLVEVSGNAVFHDPRNTSAPTYNGQPAEPGSLLLASGREVPALQIGGTPFVAGDADGDGVADAVLWKLPIAPIDGVTYYVATRILDNNSAVNASIANEWNTPPGSPGPNYLYGNYLPSQIDILGMLYNNGSVTPGAQLLELNAYRFNNASAINPPSNDDGTPRVDYTFNGFYDALWMQLGRRINFPGINADGNPFRPLPISDSMSLAYHFLLINPDASPSTSLEEALRESVYDNVVNAAGNSRDGEKTFGPSEISDWFDELDFESETPGDATTYLPIRPLLVGRNPVSNHIAPKPLSASIPAPVAGSGATSMAGYPALTYGVTKTSVNHADFDELWRAYYSVMADDPNSAPIDELSSLSQFDPYYAGKFLAASPYGPDTTEPLHPGLMFRSSIRDVRGSFSSTNVIRFVPFQQMLLRAALAAVNTIDLRDSDDAVTAVDIALNVERDGTVENRIVTVFGNERQPFITEVYVNTDTLTGSNPKGYVAIELHNPYPSAIALSPSAGTDGWTVGMIDRRAAGSTVAKPRLAVTNLDGTTGAVNFNFPPGTVVPGNGFLILENLVSTPDAVNATARPTGAQNAAIGLGATGAPTLSTNCNVVSVPNLHRVLLDSTDTTSTGGEFVLLRTRNGDATRSGLETSNIAAMVPIDQFDFTGVSLSVAPTLTLLHYVRANGGTDDWKFVYPGRYNGALAGVRHQGTDHETGWAGGDDRAGYTYDDAPALGQSDGDSSFPTEFVIQLQNVGFPGPSPSPAAFPFGGFPRIGDILQVPFFGAYTVFDTDTVGASFQLYEMNSLPIDSIFAEDTDTNNDPQAADTGVEVREQVGRFFPLSAVAGPPATDDFFDDNSGTPPQTAGYPNTTTPPQVEWRYRWARDLFEYLTVLSPHDDYFLDSPQAVSTDGVDQDMSGTANDDSERAVPVEGLININTASWKVLATLPMVIDATGAVVPVANTELAKAIIYWRDVDGDPDPLITAPHGPFQDLYELNEVYDLRPSKDPTLGFQSAMGSVLFTAASTEPGDEMGDLTPFGATKDLVRADWEEKTLVLNRISNLITTRSDSFTAYILIQGWRNAETANAEMVAQRRVGVILDRSGVSSTTTKSNLSTIRFPQN